MAGINSLPAVLQSVIQQGYLEHRFQQALRAKLGFRSVADREPFMAGIGETITKTRAGLLQAVTAPMQTAAVTDFTSGLTPANYSVEQYILAVNQYANPIQLNNGTSLIISGKFQFLWPFEACPASPKAHNDNKDLGVVAARPSDIRATCA